MTIAGGLENLKENLFNDEEMRNAFLNTKNEYVYPVIEEVEVKEKPESVELSKYLIKKFGVQTLEEMDSEEGWKSYFSELKEAINEYEKPDKDFPKFVYRNLFRYALKYSKTNGVEIKRVENNEARSAEINKRIDENEYRNWLDSLFSKLTIQEGIYNGKDPYKNNGDRKSFKQLHWDVNLENIVNAMKLQENGETILGSSFSYTMGRK